MGKEIGHSIALSSSAFSGISLTFRSAAFNRETFAVARRDGIA